MQQGFITIGMLAGGLGLFLLAVGMITDGLKLAAGHSLRSLLERSTRSTAHSIASGVSITAIVQSSSAVTVATIGFVNAGLITMYQALGIVYGANIGTTMTGWLVAVVGFKFKIEFFALPMIGVGMLLRLSSGDRRWAHIGTALAGFGLFFIGIDVLKEAFEGLATSIDLQKITADGLAGILVFLGIGFLMTVLTQSSSAAIALTLTAATGGVLGIYAAAAMVIGANIGTTSTAALAVIGATPNAKRVAAAHVVFNLLTGIVALLLLPVLFIVIESTTKLVGLETIPAVTLALFHTTFNILGVVIMWPVSERLANFLSHRFITQEEIEGRPRYLDKTVAVTPMLALNALTLELSRIADIVRRMALASLSVESRPGQRISIDHAIVNKLSNAVAEFIAKLGRGTLTGEVTVTLAQLLRTEQHLLASSNLALGIARAQSEIELVEVNEIQDYLARYRSDVAHLMKMTNLESEDFSMQECEVQLKKLQASYDEVKTVLLRAGSEKNTSIPNLLDILEQNSRIRRMARQVMKATQHLNEINTIIGISTSETTSTTGQTEGSVVQEQK